MRPSVPRLLLFLSVLAQTIPTIAAEVDPIGVILTAEKQDFEGTTQKASADLLLSLGRKQQLAQQSGDLDGVQSVQAEIENLMQFGTLPDSITTRSYESQVASARKRMEEAYSNAIAAYTRAGDIERAQAVQQQLEEFRGTAIDRRNHWTGKERVLRMISAGAWVEEATNRETFKFTESARTAQYVDIRDNRRGVTLRITADKIFSGRDRSPGQWNTLDVGGWTKAQH